MVSLDLTHLDALRLRLSHERDRLERAATPFERTLRETWCGQIEREISGELAHLGIEDAPACELTDDELLAALRA